MAKFNGIFRENALTREVIDTHVTLAEVKRNLQFDEPDQTHPDDDQLQILIDAAVQEAENYTGRVIAYTELVKHAYNYSGQSIIIQVAPFNRIKSIQISIDNGATFTPTTNYTTVTTHLGFEIFFDNSLSVDEIKISFYAGYSAATLPAAIRKAVIQLASDSYDTERSNYSYQVTPNNSFKRALSGFIINRY